MSDGAYLKCGICGERVHMNHTCKFWNKNNCQGDPWGVKKRLENSISNIEKLILKHEDEIRILNETLKEFKKDLTKQS